MKNLFSKVALTAVLSVALLGAGTANAETASTSAKHTKHAKRSVKKLFGQAIVCDENGTATLTTYYFGIPFSHGGVPNSNLCN